MLGMVLEGCYMLGMVLEGCYMLGMVLEGCYMLGMVKERVTESGYGLVVMKMVQLEESQLQ